MKIEWNKVTWYSKLVAVILGVAIFALGMYIGITYQKGMDALECAEQPRNKCPLTEEEVKMSTSESQYKFIEIGNIRNIPPPGSMEDWWVLVYEKPGEPALTKRLLFTSESLCAFAGNSMRCDSLVFKQGERVKVMGHANTEWDIVVEWLEVIEE